MIEMEVSKDVLFPKVIKQYGLANKNSSKLSGRSKRKILFMGCLALSPSTSSPDKLQTVQDRREKDIFAHLKKAGNRKSHCGGGTCNDGISVGCHHTVKFFSCPSYSDSGSKAISD